MNEIVDDLDGTLARVDYILEAAKQLRDKALAEVAEIVSTKRYESANQSIGAVIRLEAL